MLTIHSHSGPRVLRAFSVPYNLGDLLQSPETLSSSHPVPGHRHTMAACCSCPVTQIKLSSAGQHGFWCVQGSFRVPTALRHWLTPCVPGRTWVWRQKWDTDRSVDSHPQGSRPARKVCFLLPQKVLPQPEPPSHATFRGSPAYRGFTTLRYRPST